MKNILTILAEAGIELTEEQKTTINKTVLENYRTIADYNNATARRDEYKQSLDDVQEKLKGFDGVDVKDLQDRITGLEGELQAEKDAREEDSRRNDREKVVDTYLNDKKFVNDITRNSIKKELLEELDKESAKGKSVDDIFTGLITDDDGNQLDNVLVDEKKQEMEKGKAKFTTSRVGNEGGTITKEDFAAMTLDERTKLKDSDPELYKSLRK